MNVPQVYLAAGHLFKKVQTSASRQNRLLRYHIFMYSKLPLRWTERDRQNLFVLSEILLKRMFFALCLLQESKSVVRLNHEACLTRVCLNESLLCMAASGRIKTSRSMVYVTKPAVCHFWSPGRPFLWNLLHLLVGVDTTLPWLVCDVPS